MLSAEPRAQKASLALPGGVDLARLSEVWTLIGRQASASFQDKQNWSVARVDSQPASQTPVNSNSMCVRGFYLL